MKDKKEPDFIINDKDFYLGGNHLIFDASEILIYTDRQEHKITICYRLRGTTQNISITKSGLEELLKMIK